jgi:hypothetical protein
MRRDRRWMAQWQWSSLTPMGMGKRAHRSKGESGFPAVVCCVGTILRAHVHAGAHFPLPSFLPPTTSHHPPLPRHLWARFSWGYVAAMVTDKTMLRELMEEDPNFVNPLYIHLSQKLLHGLL